MIIPLILSALNSIILIVVFALVIKSLPQIKNFYRDFDRQRQMRKKVFRQKSNKKINLAEFYNTNTRDFEDVNDSEDENE